MPKMAPRELICCLVAYQEQGFFGVKAGEGPEERVAIEKTSELGAR